MDNETYTLFLDESGDHLLYPLHQFDTNPHFETHCTLTGVVVGHHKKDVMKEELKTLKQELWFTDNVVLHSIEIRNKKGAFALFHYKPELYELFKNRMNLITLNAEPTIVCSSLDKKLWVTKYPKKLYFQDDPYEQAFVYLLERYAHFLNSNPNPSTRGKIVAEQRGGIKDRSLLETYAAVKNQGTQYFPKSHFSRLADKIEFKSKKFNVAGLQLSDYLCYPFYMNHKYPQKDNQHYEFAKQFVYSGSKKQYGHKKWPV